MKKILVIDDEEQMRDMLQGLLEQRGYEVVVAPNGKVGARLCTEEQIGVVITDLLMPEMDGIETIMALKREFPDVKIIAISGGGRIGPEDYLKMANSLGAQYTLKKPFSTKELLEAVKDLMGSSENL